MRPHIKVLLIIGLVVAVSIGVYLTDEAYANMARHFLRSLVRHLF